MSQIVAGILFSKGWVEPGHTVSDPMISKITAAVQ